VKRLSGVAVAVLIAFVVFYGGFRLVHHALGPVVPPIVARNADAHRLLSGSIGARVDRLLHDRPPPLSERSHNPRLVALTFDDGPYPVETPLLLDVLAELHVPATFFLIGDDAEHFPGLVRRIQASGNEIANHTQTHPPNFQALSAAEVTSELDRGAQTLRRYSNDPAITTMMRPPHGRFTEATVLAAQRAGYSVILWDDDPGDWRPVTPQQISNHLDEYATAPDIVLLHSGRLSTVEALPEIVARFRAAGFKFVTVGQMMSTVPVAQILHPAKFGV
jgi:peptidoglycan/xylan/chitin deacetylase (PgdA/CDA1 family)